jgi:hypothetical protein
MTQKKKPVGESGGLFLYVLCRAGLAAKDQAPFLVIIRIGMIFTSS